MKYVDIHGHINFPEYDADREEVIKRAKDAGVGIIVVGTDLESSARCVELAEKHDEMWAIVGMHPTEAMESDVGRSSGTIDFNATEFQLLAKHPKVVAVGECGLDYFHSKLENIAHQREVFIQHVKLANAVKKPLMLHVRNKAISPLQKDTSMVINAYQEAIQILKDYAKVPANFHFFAGTFADMNEAFSTGCTVSFTGVITFARSYDELIKSAPLQKIMTETDCPYVAPVPHRGKRNEPFYVIEVVKQIAKIRAEDEGKVAEQLLKNACKFFGIQK